MAGGKRLVGVKLRVKGWLGRRYSEVNLGIGFLNEKIPEPWRVNLLLISLTYYQAFQNVRSILQISLTPNKEHKMIFTEFPIVGFRNGKSLKDYLVRAALPKMDNAGGSEPCGKGTCQVCDHVITNNSFTTKACGQVFKIQS